MNRVRATDLGAGMVLLGSEGGESIVYEISPDSLLPGFLTVWTEHGPLLFDPDESYPVRGSEGGDRP